MFQGPIYRLQGTEKLANLKGAHVRAMLGRFTVSKVRSFWSGGIGEIAEYTVFIRFHFLDPSKNDLEW